MNKVHINNNKIVKVDQHERENILRDKVTMKYGNDMLEQLIDLYSNGL